MLSRISLFGAPPGDDPDAGPTTALVKRLSVIVCGRAQVLAGRVYVLRSHEREAGLRLRSGSGYCVRAVDIAYESSRDASTSYVKAGRPDGPRSKAYELTSRAFD